MDEKLINAANLAKLVAKVAMYDVDAAKYVARYALAYMEGKLSDYPNINFAPHALNLDTFCHWQSTPHGHYYWSKLHSKVADVDGGGW